MNDIYSLGDRIKKEYENSTRYYLNESKFTIIRIDGKAFHTFTKSFDKPFDDLFISIMNKTAEELCKRIQGVKLAYVQSDEISLLLIKNENSEIFFNGNIQKIASVSASIATEIFNKEFIKYHLETHDDFNFDDLKFANFDSRVFNMPNFELVKDYFIYRQKDCIRNSIQMTGSTYFSQKELNRKNVKTILEMLRSKNINWNTFSNRKKYGGFIYKKITI
jgi:tRNA(His) 5'-end guanylyltransferase